MTNRRKILLVEGESDKSFFEEICKKLSLDASVLVAPPIDLGGTHNTKGGVSNHLKILLPQLDDGQISHIAVVVDADYDQNGGGYQRTMANLTKIVEPFGFVVENKSETISGICFKNTNGLADLGLWIMPDNKKEGMLEDWIKSCVIESERELFQQAVQAVNQISTPKFKPHSYSKAEVATWLAWQKKPGQGLYATIENKLLNDEYPLFKKLEEWMVKIFP